MTTAIITQADQKAIELVTNGLTSEHSKRAYSKALADFLGWMQANQRPFVKATIQEYRQSLAGSPASINLRMSAIRKLAQEAAALAGCATPLGAEAAQLYTLFVNSGHAGLDYSAIIRLIQGNGD